MTTLSALLLAYPEIDPILFELGPLVIRWYALAYLAGLFLGWKILVRMCAAPPHAMDAKQADDFLLWATLGVVFGGRLGYVLFYDPAYYMENPALILQVWRGGMSFHGGFLGVMVAGLIYVRKYKLNALAVADALAMTAPVGLFFGRLANFINGELVGRVSDVPWAMIFPTGGPDPRHPSQLYEAGLEGLALFIVLQVAYHRYNAALRPGLLVGLFLAGYWAARSFVEMFRQPDAHIGLLAGGVTMGQVLSIPMLLIGLYLIWRARQAPRFEP